MEIPPIKLGLIPSPFWLTIMEFPSMLEGTFVYNRSLFGRGLEIPIEERAAIGGNP